MPSSLIPAARRQPLVDLLSQVPDQRKERGRQHPLAGLLAVGIAADGKTVRGAKGKHGKAPHLVAALADGIGAVLGQVAVDAKSNEIPAVRELLEAFADLTGAVVTMDALHAQHDTARAVLDRRADYVMTVKVNMPTLYAQHKKLPWKNVPGFSHVAWVRLFSSEALPDERAARPAGSRVPCRRIRLRGPVRCPVPAAAAAAVTGTM